MKIVTFEGKHGDSTYLVPDDATWDKVCAITVKDWYNSRYFYQPTEHLPDADTQALIDLSDEAVAALPESVRDDLLRKRKKARTEALNDAHEYKRERIIFDNAKRIAEAESLEEAVKIVQQRRGKFESMATVIVEVACNEGWEYQTYKEHRPEKIEW